MKQMKQRGKEATVLGGICCLSGWSWAFWRPAAPGGRKKQEEPGSRKRRTGFRIGLSFDTFVLERWQRDRDAFVARAAELGADVNVQNANGDVEEQIAQIEYLIEKKMDVIAVDRGGFPGAFRCGREGQAGGHPGDRLRPPAYGRGRGSVHQL